MSLEKIKESIKTAETLDQAKINFFNTLYEIHEENPDIKITYIIGLVTSAGEDKIAENLALLEERSKSVREQLGGIVFSVADIFNNDIFDEFKKSGNSENVDYRNFCLDFLKTECVGAIVLTPGWENSIGARREKALAESRDLEIYSLDEDGILTQISNATVVLTG